MHRSLVGLPDCVPALCACVAPPMPYPVRLRCSTNILPRRTAPWSLCLLSWSVMASSRGAHRHMFRTFWAAATSWAPRWSVQAYNQMPPLPRSALLPGDLGIRIHSGFQEPKPYCRLPTACTVAEVLTKRSTVGNCGLQHLLGEECERMLSVIPRVLLQAQVAKCTAAPFSIPCTHTQ